MTMGDCGIAILRVAAALLIIWFFYRGHNIVRLIVRYARNIFGATVDACREWASVVDEALFGKEDEDNGCKDM